MRMLTIRGANSPLLLCGEEASCMQQIVSSWICIKRFTPVEECLSLLEQMLYMLKSTKYYYEMVLRRVTIKARLKLSWDYNHKK